MLHRLYLVCVLVAGAACVSACDESLSSIAGPTPSLEPTFTSIQRDIFEATDSSGRSACVSCHTTTGRAPAGGLSLEHAVAYDALVNAAVREKAASTRVVPGDAANSYLMQKLSGDASIVGRRMPQNGPPYLTEGQILIIQTWINAGAPRN